MKPNKQHPHFYQAGFSLVEIMVGLVIGLLATLVILQVFALFEGQKRTTTGTSDAQTNGNVALYSIKRDLEMAGYGLLPIGAPNTADSPLECAAPSFTNSGVTNLAPVTITDGSTLSPSSPSDVITIRYSNSQTGGSYTTISALGTAPPINSGTTATVGENLGCSVGDVAIIVDNAGSCYLTAVSGVSPAPGIADHTGISLASVAGLNVTATSNLACLGKWNEVEYQINPAYDPTNSNNSQAYLQRNDTPGVASKAVPLVMDIVNIQAQYGVSLSANDNQIDQWTDATGSFAASALSGNTITSVAARNRIKAVRIAVVARSGQYEKTNVTEQCSSLTADAPSGLCAWSGSSANTTVPSPAPAIDLSKDPNWQHYRYRVFETVIPLRNVIWSKGTF
jgi:type IV pilus assembly protein PilW